VSRSQLLRALALARIGLGVAVLAGPASVPRPLVGRARADQPWARLLTRMTGIREIAIGALALRAPDDRVVVGFAAACDAVDGWSALADRELPLLVRALWGVTALPVAALEAGAALGG
jgi:hypothetical protein